MKRYIFCSVLLGAIALGGCAQESSTPAPEPTDDVQADGAASSEDGVGTLAVRANGEDFVRQGFVSKDGWQIDFEHVYVNVAEVTAYQSDPPFDAEAETVPSAAVEAELVSDVTTVDLAEGDEAADPILLVETEAPAGRYNALGWKLVPAEDGPAAGQTVKLIGTAEKDGEAVNFTLSVDQPYTYVCGDFVGDERKGILEAGNMADLEATFHFDHIFGDAEAPADDEINTGALGFDPLAALADGNQLEVSLADLSEQLDPADYALLEKSLISLGHVGEGHCAELEATPEAEAEAE
ncbi:MAG: DUF4382 domain-containing protein [Cyanobacteria bacterium P01_H01_bin.119]